jgi:septal ring factor EnvC (AmiA/AmiB activator)
MKLFAVLLFLGLSLTIQAQEFVFEGATYEVKGKTILKDKVDVTTTLTVEEKNVILEALNEQKGIEAERVEVEKKVKEAEKAKKKAEKEQKRAEKKQKKIEKTLKRKEKAQINFEKATNKYNKTTAKYESLKKRGKLSPVAEAKWIDKIEKLRFKRDKFERKLK